jgi:hypothetical protein
MPESPTSGHPAPAQPLPLPHPHAAVHIPAGFVPPAAAHAPHIPAGFVPPPAAAHAPHIPAGFALPAAAHAPAAGVAYYYDFVGPPQGDAHAAGKLKNVHTNVLLRCLLAYGIVVSKKLDKDAMIDM